MSRGDGAAYPLTPDADVAQIRAEDVEFYDQHAEWDSSAWPTRPSDFQLVPQRIVHMRTTTAGRMPCCEKSPWDRAPWEGLTKYPGLVTCNDYGERYLRGLHK